MAKKKMWMVLAPDGSEGVLFDDKGDALKAAGCEPMGFIASCIADFFHELYTSGRERPNVQQIEVETLEPTPEKTDV